MNKRTNGTSMTERESNELNKRITDLKESIEKKKMDVLWHKENPKVWNDGGKLIREGEQFIRENEQLLGYLEELRELKEKATAKKVKRIYEYGMFDCPHCNKVLPIGKKYPHCIWCGGLIDYDWSEGKE